MPDERVGFKNVTLHKFLKNGVDSFKLLGDSGEIVSFSMFIDQLEKKKVFNTFNSYAHAVAHFFDYFYEAGCHVAARENRAQLSRGELKEIIEGWSDYLTLGGASGNPLVVAVSETLPRKLVKTQTNNSYHAALKLFLKFSEVIRKEGDELGRYGFVLGSYDPNALYEDMGKFMSVSGQQKAAMFRSTMLSGVIAGGPKEQEVDFLPLIDLDEDEFDGKNLFPLDQFEAFENALNTSRDKALYCFYAASGCRASEALQLLWDDIDLAAQEVHLVNPKKRLNHPSYLFLTPNQRERLAWKGRATHETFLIEPFASKFWRHLKEYVDREYVPHGQHKFVFQTLKGKYRGAPYFTSKASSRQEIFKSAMQLSALPETLRGPHSLRHAYGTYVLNYIPNVDGGYGLPIAIVKNVMGHESIKSTEKYARFDRDLVRAQITYANKAAFANGLVAQKQSELKVKALLELAMKLGWNGDAQQLETA